MSLQKLSIIIPVYNEQNTIIPLIQKVDTVGLPNGVEREIIVINDASNDGTLERLETLQDKSHIYVFNRVRRYGKTAAVKFGISKAKGDFIIIQDADLEYNPTYYSQLLMPLLNGEADVVYGSRFKGKIKNMKLINRIANKVSTTTLNILFSSNISDMHTCYKLFRRDILSNINITSSNFSFDTEITAELLRRGIKIYEVPIEYRARSRKEGKKITWLTAVETYFVLLKCKFRR